VGMTGDGYKGYEKLGSFFPKTDAPLNILDIGCGTGIELDYIWAQAPNAHFTCVDLSRGMLDLLLADHPDSHERITVIEASYVDWEYPADAYDIVVSSATMHHFWPDEKIAVYKKILHSLKPGGWYIENDFIVDSIAAEQYKRRYDTITANVQGGIKPGEYHIDIPCSLDVQLALLRDAGFTSVIILEEDLKARGSGAILKGVR